MKALPVGGIFVEVSSKEDAVYDFLARAQDAVYALRACAHDAVYALRARAHDAVEFLTRAQARWRQLPDNQKVGAVVAGILLVLFVIWLLPSGRSSGSKSSDGKPKQQSHTVQPAPAAIPSGPSADQVSAYQLEYYTCGGITLADIKRDYGFSQAGMTPAEVILKMENETYGESAKEQYAYEGCLDAYSHRRERYPLNR